MFNAWVCRIISRCGEREAVEGLWLCHVTSYGAVLLSQVEPSGVVIQRSGGGVCVRSAGCVARGRASGGNVA